MIISPTKFFLISFLTILLLILGISCDKDGTKINGPSAPATDLTGVWIVNKILNGNCQGSNYPAYEMDIVKISQATNTLNIYLFSADTTINGSISGRQVTWRANTIEDGNTTSINFKGTASTDGKTITGSATWKWSNGNYTCSGTGAVNANKSAESMAKVSGKWEGTWESSAHNMNDVFNVNIIQQDSILTGSIDIPDIGLFDAALKGLVVGNLISFGDIDKSINFTGIVVHDSIANGIYSYPAQHDNGSWKAVRGDTSYVPASNWKKIDVGYNSSQQAQLTIGEGRNDGLMRIYSGDGMFSSNGKIHEYSYNADKWELMNFDKNEGGMVTIAGIDIIAGRNDGVNRIYASGHDVIEYSYIANSWSWKSIFPDIGWTNDLTTGDAHNDGLNRIYLAEWDGIRELTYNNGKWDQLKIDNNDESINGLLITDGRNDGLLRLYALTNDHVLEYTWVDTDWNRIDCGSTGAVNLEFIIAGEGRNDGVNRIYASGNAGFYELNYSGNKWNYQEVAPISNATAMVIGAGRNDDINRIYIAVDQNELQEYSFNKKWYLTSDIATDINIPGIVLGNARNDMKNRIYITAFDNHIYEYTFEKNN